MNYQDNAALMELKVLIFKKSELKDGHKHNILFFFLNIGISKKFWTNVDKAMAKGDKI